MTTRVTYNSCLGKVTNEVTILVMILKSSPNFKDCIILERVLGSSGHLKLEFRVCRALITWVLSQGVHNSLKSCIAFLKS